MGSSSTTSSQSKYSSHQHEDCKGNCGPKMCLKCCAHSRASKSIRVVQSAQSEADLMAISHLISSWFEQVPLRHGLGNSEITVQLWPYRLKSFKSNSCDHCDQRLGDLCCYVLSNPPVNHQEKTKHADLLNLRLVSDFPSLFACCTLPNLKLVLLSRWHRPHFIGFLLLLLGCRDAAFKNAPFLACWHVGMQDDCF